MGPRSRGARAQRVKSEDCLGVPQRERIFGGEEESLLQLLQLFWSSSSCDEVFLPFGASRDGEDAKPADAVLVLVLAFAKVRGIGEELLGEAFHGHGAPVDFEVWFFVSCHPERGFSPRGICFECSASGPGKLN